MAAAVFSEPRTLSRYRLIARLGGGGMADVYLALLSETDGFEKLYVLKVLRVDGDEQQRAEFLQMFEAEGRLAARLNHPNIVQSHEVGTDQGLHFIAMEHLEGQPLSRVQDRWALDPGCFPLPLRLFVLSQLLDALDYTHSFRDFDGTPLPIVHRDVSPQNVFITDTGQVKLLDFGIAKTSRSPRTRAGVVKGKVQYLAPEQLRCAQVDGRADLFSVGVLLWECLAGRSMYEAASEYDIVRRLVDGQLPKLTDVAPDVAPALLRVVTRALAIQPERRFPDARTFRKELVDCVDLRGVSSRDVSEAMQALFVAERRAMTQTIRRAFASSEEVSAPPLPQILDPPKISDLKADARMIRRPSPAPETGPRTKAPKVQPQFEPPTPGSAVGARFTSVQRWFAVGAGVAMLLLAVLTSGGQRKLRESGEGVIERAAQSERQAIHALATSPAVPSAVPATPSVSVRLSAEPAAATLSLDGQALPTNPYEHRRAWSSQPHTLTVTAPGYQERTLSLTFNRDIDLALTLAALPPSRPRAAAPRLATTTPVRPAKDPEVDYIRDLPPPPDPTARAR